MRPTEVVLLALHSTLPAAEQRRVFDTPPRHTRKVVLSTNIAETSVTIPDVVYVVDAGKLRERQYDPHRGVSSLVEVHVSKASAQQRKGRAGRVQAGMCFSLFTAPHFNNRMKAFQTPEIKRVPLDELLLTVASLGSG